MSVLYISYNGMMEPLGQAQVLSYLEHLSAKTPIHLLSFEKAQDWTDINKRKAISDRIRSAGISWHPRQFRASPPVVRKLLDTADLRKSALKLADTESAQLIHCRSYVAAQAALSIKLERGIPFVFDMRGFWVDERREGGRWPKSNPFYNVLYNAWKKKEANFIREASEIVVLTHRARSIIESWKSYRGQPISVIPCSVDHDHFRLPAPEERSRSRHELGIDDRTLLVVYLGSLGTIYKLTEMLQLFAALRRGHPSAKFLFIGKHDAAQLYRAAMSAGIPLQPDDFIVKETSHAGVPRLLGAADVAVAFREACFSSAGASPTKLGEYFACGLPVIVNDGVGDVGEIVRSVGGGIVTSSAITLDELQRIAHDIDSLLRKDRRRIREASQKIHDLGVAVAAYDEIYRRNL